MTRLVTVFGGSGFVGRHLVRRLAATGARVRVAVRDPEAAAFLKPMGDVGQIVPTRCDVKDTDDVARACEGADWVINLVGILYERGATTFDAMHREAARRIAEAAKSAGATRMVQMSALGADAGSEADYARTKALGEQEVLQVFPTATIVRPSVVFGPEDGFFNLFANMARFSPVLPVFSDDAPSLKRKGAWVGIDFYGDGGPKFQPVYVGNVAEAMMKALEDPGHEGKVYELGGPRVYSMKQIMELILEETGRKRGLLPTPMWVARLQASVLQFLPKPLLTPDQVRLLEVDNVVSGDHPTFDDLGIHPDAAEGIIPTYLKRFRPTWLQAKMRGQA